MTILRVSPLEARRRIADGSAVLVDIREEAEHACEAIPEAKSEPLSKFDASGVAARCGTTPAIIFHCQTGKRTADNAARLASCSAPEIYLLEGGLNAWKSAGYQTRVDRSKPSDMQRQVQIAAGSLVSIGLALAFFVSPWFALLSAFLETGLTFAGISG